MTDISTLRPIDLFQKHGMDALEISKLTGASEAEVYNSLHVARTKRLRRLNAELAAARKERLARREAQKRLIKYAGHSG